MNKPKSKSNVKRATLDVKKLQRLSDGMLKKITGGGYYGNSYWN